MRESFAIACNKTDGSEQNKIRRRDRGRDEPDDERTLTGGRVTASAGRGCLSVFGPCLLVLARLALLTSWFLRGRHGRLRLGARFGFASVSLALLFADRGFVALGRAVIRGGAWSSRHRWLRVERWHVGRRGRSARGFRENRGPRGNGLRIGIAQEVVVHVLLDDLPRIGTPVCAFVGARRKGKGRGFVEYDETLVLVVKDLLVRRDVRREDEAILFLHLVVHDDPRGLLPHFLCHFAVADELGEEHLLEGTRTLLERDRGSRTQRVRDVLRGSMRHVTGRRIRVRHVQRRRRLLRDGHAVLQHATSLRGWQRHHRLERLTTNSERVCEQTSAEGE